MVGKLSLEETLAIGSKNNFTINIEEVSKPLIVRGVTSKSEVDQCSQMGRDFYYIDTGYFGNFPSLGNPGGKKRYHRIVKNENQHTDILDSPPDRWKKLLAEDPRLNWTGWKKYEKKILVVMPNPKACRYYNYDYEKWVEETEKEIKKHCDLPVEVRVKGSRVYRNIEYSIYDAFDTGVYATIAFNSIAALESVLYGIPAFVTVPCAASPLASTDLSKLNDPYYPNQDLIYQHCCGLAYGQFTLEEIETGYAWNILKNN